MSIQISVQPTKNSTPPRLVVHGGGGVGKSTFASKAPRPWFLPTEQGLSGLEAQMIVADELSFDDDDEPICDKKGNQEMKPKKRLTSVEEVDSALDFCEKNLSEFDTLVLDSGDWLETLVHQDIVSRDQKATNMGEACGGFGKSYIEAQNAWQYYLDRLDWFNHHDKMIIMICHSKAITFDDPLTESYDIWQLKLHSTKNATGSLEITKEWADVIGFAEQEKLTRQSKADPSRNMSISSGKRSLHLESTAGFTAKCRYDWMPKKMALDMNEFMKAFYGKEK